MYVQRVDGKIIRACANQQDWETEWLDDNDPELVSFLSPPPAPEVSPADKLKAFLAANPDVAALM